MNILTTDTFYNELLPVLKPKYHIHAELQRMSGMRAFETGLKTYVKLNGTSKARILRPEELDFEKRTIILIGKQGKKREVPTKIDMELIREHYSQKKMPTYSAYHWSLQKAFEEIGFKCYSPNLKMNVTHQLRAFFIVDWCKKFGTDLYTLQELVGITGHSGINTIQPYLDVISQGEGIKKYHDRF